MLKSTPPHDRRHPAMPQSRTPKASLYAELGKVILRAREQRGLTRRQLGDAAGYTGANTGITINKVERGELRPADERLHAIADALGLSHAKVDALSRRVKANPAAAAQAWKANRKRIERLNDRTGELHAEVEAHYQQLRLARGRIEDQFLTPFLDYVARLQGAEDDLDRALADLRALGLGDSTPELQQQLQLNRSEIAGSLGRALARRTVRSRAAATYPAMAAFASASTGNAINSLVGAASSRATLAALGGRPLTADGLVITRMFGVLGAIVAHPAQWGAGVGLLWTSNRRPGHARDDSARISEAETAFERTATRLRASYSWTTQAHTYLGLAESTSTKLHKIIGLHSDQPIDEETWSTMTEHRREATRLGVQLASVILTVLPLPALPTPDEESTDGEVTQVEQRTRDWNAAVLDDATNRTEKIFAAAITLSQRAGNTSA